MTSYRRRLVDTYIQELFTDLPALMITGPRGCGKTTTALQFTKTTIRLDDPRQADVFRTNPDAALQAFPEPILLDEWQEVPEVIGAVKRAVDSDFRGGRFLLTGSVHAKQTTATWPGTGRVIEVPMMGLTMRELTENTTARPFLDRIADVDFEPPIFVDDLDVNDYVKAALHGGFPAAVFQKTNIGRQAWLDGYLEVLLTRDASGVDGPRNPEKLRQFFTALALHSAGVIAEKALYETAEINRGTADAYETLLRNLFILDAVQPWHANRIKRLTKMKKRYILDTGLIASVLRADAPAVLRDSDLLGRLLDTFIYVQLRAELPVCATKPQLFHLRDTDGRHEIDHIVEYGMGKVVGIEVKATGAPGRNSAKHLSWLRDSLGEKFIRGIVLHTGPNSFRLDDRIYAVPIAAIWR